MKLYGTKFHKKGNAGMITVYPSNNGNGTNYDPKLAAYAIREKVQCDESIKLLFIMGEGDISALLREILEINEKDAHRWLRRMRKKRGRRHKVRKDRQHLTHAAALLPVHLKNGFTY
jgi:hypothetical protein